MDKIKNSVPKYNVFVMGGRRVGATTILASMTQNVEKVMSGANIIMQSSGIENCRTLLECTYNLKNFFTKESDTLFCTDIGPTCNQEVYNFNLRKNHEKQMQECTFVLLMFRVNGLKNGAMILMMIITK